MSLNHILLGGTWERVTLRSRALVAIRRNCYVQQNFNSWWKTSDERTQTFLFPFLFIYLFIFLSFGFSFRSIDVLDCIESRRNIFGFWILLIIPVPFILGDPGAVSRAGRKGATKVFKYRRKSPWVPTLTGPFPNGQENAGSWLGTKNALYYCAQSANSISSEFVHDDYYLATVARFVASFTKLS